ncbi:hypothetical protein Hanom_Chr16g01432581 [Helianthus anomalus]
MSWVVRSKVIFFHKVKDDEVMERFQAMKKEHDKSIRYLLYFIFLFLFFYYCVIAW